MKYNFRSSNMCSQLGIESQASIPNTREAKAEAPFTVCSR